MIRFQPILLSKMMLEERFNLFREDQLSINIDFLAIVWSQYIHSHDTAITQHPFGQLSINTNSFP